MSSFQQKSRFLRGTGWEGLGKVARIAASLGLAFSLIGPMPVSQTAEAGVEPNEWDDLRPPRTDINVSKTTGAGFTYLAGFGDNTVLSAGGGAAGGLFSLTHPVATGANGDVFVAGKAATGTAPVVYKSSDGGLTWEDSATVGAAGSRIVGIVVSSKYPSDNYVYVAFTDDNATADGGNGVAESADGGRTFTVIANDNASGGAIDLDGGGGAGTFDLRDIAISPDFDRGNNAGEIAVGGRAGAGSVLSVFTLARPGGTLTAASIADLGTEAATDETLAVAYSTKRDDYILGRVVTRVGTGTLGQIRGGGGFPVESAADTIFAAVATTATAAFPTDFSATGTGVGWYVGTAGPGTDNVYKRTSSSWVSQAVACGAADCPISGIGVRGIGADANVLALEGGDGAAGRRSFRSTNGGSSWSTKDIDSTDAIVALGASRVSVGLHPDFVNNGMAFIGVPAVNGGVMKTSNKGASWADAGLSNRAGTASTVSVASDSQWFVRTRVGTPPAGTVDACPTTFPCEWYLTTNMGDSAGYQRVVRSTMPTDLNDFEELDRSPTFTTDGVVYLTRRGTGSNRVIKSTDGGYNWKSLTTNPTDTEQIVNVALVSATTVYVGTNEGKILWSTDGGNSWQTGTTDVGNRITDIDFTRDFTTSNTMFVTAVSSSNAYEVWKSTDGGKTFIMLGTSVGSWGSGTAAPAAASLSLSPNHSTNKMAYLAVRGAGDNDIWRINTDTAGAKWTGLGLVGGDQEAAGLNLFNAPGIGDGELLYFNADVDTGGVPHIARTYNPLTLTKTTYAKNVMATRSTFGDGVGAQTSTLAIRTHANGRQAYRVAGGRITNLLEPTNFLSQPMIASPADNTSVPTNTGQNGVPTTLSWSNIDRVQSWDVQIALDAEFNQTIVDNAAQGSTIGVLASLCGGVGAAAANGCVTTPSAVVSSTAAAATNQIIVGALVQGQTYYWRVRARTIGSTAGTAQLHPGAWSKVSKFSVANQGAPTSPEPQLPLDGTTQPNLGPTELSWNNPAGTVQFHIQVLPLNNDGPAIDLIIGDPDQVASQKYTVLPPVFGQGNYVILPGSSYNWRVRVTTKSGSVGVNDSSWGPWSGIRSYKTPRPSAATIQVQPVTPSATPTISWKDSNTSNFYYEVQLSQDRTFNADPATATAAVYWNLVHGGETNPLNSWMLPSGTTLEKGKTYYARVRQRVQATPLGADEPGISWSQTVSFVVP